MCTVYLYDAVCRNDYLIALIEHEDGHALIQRDLAGEPMHKQKL